MPEISSHSQHIEQTLWLYFGSIIIFFEKLNLFLHIKIAHRQHPKSPRQHMTSITVKILFFFYKSKTPKHRILMICKIEFQIRFIFLKHNLIVEGTLGKKKRKEKADVLCYVEERSQQTRYSMNFSKIIKKKKREKGLVLKWLPFCLRLLQSMFQFLLGKCFALSNCSRQQHSNSLRKHLVLKLFAKIDSLT